MSRKDDIKILIIEHNRHLQKLEEQKAKWGLDAPTRILTEIEDRKAEIEKLQEELAALGEEIPSEINQQGKRILHNLPQPDYQHFIGREAELKQIRQLLLPYPQSRHFVITIDGIGGIGKSALALEMATFYLHHYHEMSAEEHFEAIVWATAKQTILTGEGIITRSQTLQTLEDIYNTITVTLEEEEKFEKFLSRYPHKLDEFIHRLLKKQRTLIIIDNLETVDDERLLTFIREVPDPTKIVVTTRHRIDVAYPVRLTGMPEKDALKLITTEAKRKNVSLEAIESVELFKRTGGVPLAIVWTIAKISFGYSIESVLAYLGHSTSDIIKFCFEAAVNSIQNQPAYKVLLALSLFATGASRKALGYIVDFGEDILSRDDALVSLEKLSLVDKKSDRFSLLPLTKSLARHKLENSPEIKSTLTERWVEFFIETAKNCEIMDHKKVAELEEDYENVREVIKWLVKSKQLGIFVRLLDAIEPFMFCHSYWADWNDWLEVGKSVAVDQNDEISRGYMLARLGRLNIYRRRGGKANPYLEEALRIFQTHKETSQLFSLIPYLARAYMFEDRYEEAEQILEEYHKKAHDLNLRRPIASIYIFKGQMYTEQCRFDEAEYSLNEALKITGVRDPSTGLNFIYWCFGELCIKRREFKQAELYLSQSLEIAKALQFINGIAQALRWFAVLREETGEYVEAIKLAKEAIKHFALLGMDYHIRLMNALIKRCSEKIKHNKN